MRLVQISFFIFLGFFNSSVFAAELLTNSTHFSDAPKWLSSTRVNKTAEAVENFMEWSVRRAEVVWYKDQKSFEAAHSSGPYALAVTIKAQNKILLGPGVNEQNFDRIFGHELVHVVSGQKYKDAIPKWLEEGVANFISKNGKIDYPGLAKRPLPEDIRQLGHPMSGTQDAILFRYMVSQALTEMIASKCDFRNLLRLSVQRKMEDYLANICRITDINASFKQWIKEKGGSVKASRI